MRREPRTAAEVKARHDASIKEIEAMILIVKAKQELKRVHQGAINYLKEQGVGKTFLRAYKAEMIEDAKALNV